MTRFGFVINDSGLHIRVGQANETNKKDRTLLLTSDPQEMMDFLGLDKDRYEKGFLTLDEIFEWVTSMPLFRRNIFEKENFSGKQARSREKRPMYSVFVTEWLPQKMTFHTRTTTPGSCDY